ncbi:hypothetical protein [Xanthomonas bundabergensis]|uniref:hypothetical protein n=1 Tax=Xanthomonas bundabergensis TaxID=3160842 RepID=UPI00351745E4
MHDVEIWVDVAFFRKNAWAQAFALLAQTRGEKQLIAGDILRFQSVGIFSPASSGTG